MHLYHMQASGNCYKVRLAAALLNQPLALVDVDITQGESRTREFLERNPNGRVPLLAIDGSTWLPESNAILWYLAEGSPLIPGTALGRARVLQWLFFEQYSHEPYIATVRYWVHILGDEAGHADQIAERRPGGYAALDVMEAHLGSNVWFAGDTFSIADIGLYAYTHVADEGGFDLSAYTAVQAWCKRVAAQPGHIGMLDPQPEVGSR